MRLYILAISLLTVLKGYGQVKGWVRDCQSQRIIPGVSITILGNTPQKERTDKNGQFSITGHNSADSVLFSFVGFESIRTTVADLIAEGTVCMKHGQHMIQEVEINTGYFRSKKDNITGSVEHLDEKQLNRAAGSNILERIEGMALGVQFVNPNGQTSSDIRVRGLSTIESDERPLIVLDNFPYEGDINTIDPSTIASITVLKDAAASSIWGAKAGNGVIVITSKRGGQDGSHTLSAQIDRGIKEIPDFTYSQDWLPSATVMDIEKSQYERGYYTFDNRVSVPLYVDYLKRFDDGIISGEILQKQQDIFKVTDTRRQAMDHLYREEQFAQYNLHFSGGVARHSYAVNVGLNEVDRSVRGDENGRYNLGISNRFRPVPWAQINTGMTYVNTRSKNNGIEYSDLNLTDVRISPYLRLVDDQGIPQAVPRNSLRPYYTESAHAAGLLDWQYRPLEEIEKIDNRTSNTELRIDTELRLDLGRYIKWTNSYQYTQGRGVSSSEYDKDSYYVRDLVNTFTQSNMTQVIPHNGIFAVASGQQYAAHYFRSSAVYQRKLDRHYIDLMGGMDVRHRAGETNPGYRLYNYDSIYKLGSSQYNYDMLYDIRPLGRSRIPRISDLTKLITDRDLSYFAHALYNLDDRYTVSSSIRWDGSNLFGVKTNQKGVPLWSIGGVWKAHEESFFPLAGLFSDFRIRASYGLTGNVNKSVTHYPTVAFQNDLTGLRSAYIRSVGNPSLRWEQVRSYNVGLDWQSKGNGFSGSFEVYRKLGEDLIGDEIMDPTTGVTGSYKINYASIMTKGFDLNLSYVKSFGPLQWNSRALVSLVKNKALKYNLNRDLHAYEYPENSILIKEGLSRDQLWAYRWYGLSPENGYPLVSMDGELSQAYAEYHNEYLKYEDLLESGVTVPPVYGSWNNTWSYGGFDVSILLTWKAGHIFRRSSMLPGGEFSALYHMDYLQRWQKPGDEKNTDVPAFIDQPDIKGDHVHLSNLYRLSEALITAGDHVRIQDISFGYNLPRRWTNSLRINSVRVQGYVKNIGIIWRKNDRGIDPDFATAPYRNPRSYNLSLKVSL